MPTTPIRGATNVSRRGALSLTVGGGAALAGCGRARAGGKLTWWGIGPQGENAPLLLPPFERETGIAVDVQSLPWTGVHEKLLTAHAGGSLPDVMLLANEWVEELAMLGALAPVPRRHAALAQGQFASVLDMVRVGGTAMAAPWTVDSWIQFYRRDLLAQIDYPAPPTDWAEWTRMAAALKRRRPDRFVTLHLLDWPEPLLNFGAQAGEPLQRDHGTRGNFASPGFRAALGFYKSIFDAGYSPTVMGVEAGDTILQFVRGAYAILPAFAETIGQLRRRVDSFPAARWAAADTPSPTGKEGVWAAGNCLAVSATSRHPEQAWRLIEFLCRPATQLHFHAITGDLPSRPVAWAAPALAASPVEEVIKRQIARAVTGQIVPETARIGTEVQLVAEHMVRGEYGVDAAAAEMNRRVDAILGKRRWLLDRGMIQ